MLLFGCGSLSGIVRRDGPPAIGESPHLRPVVSTPMSMPPVAVRLAKDAVLKAQDLSIEEGLDYERRVFYLLFATEDQKEGMAAFIEKRPPQWKGR